MHPKIYIILLNWNGFPDTLECLESLKKIDYPNFEVIVVDNNSTGDDVNIIKEKFGDFVKELIVSKDNLGFSGGNNLGIEYSLNEGADFILLLNNDTIVEPDFLSKLLDVFINKDSVGISAPQINYYNTPEIVWTVGGKISKLRGSGFAYSDKNESEIDKNEKFVTFASGCCLLIKREVFEKVGLFDEKFFLYVEDTDFCYRSLKAGYKIIVSPTSKIYHKVGSSTSEDLKQIPLYYTTRNRLHFARKNFYGFHFITTIYIFTAMLYKIIFWLLKGKLENIVVVKHAFLDYLKGKMGKINSEEFMVNG